MSKKKVSKIFKGVKCWQCSDCKKWLPAGQFSKNSRATNGLQSKCKTCQSNYRKDNPEKVRETNRRYRKNNSEKIHKYNRQYKKDNPDKARKHTCKYYENNSEKVRKYNRQYRKDNTERIREQNARVNKTLKGRARQAVKNAVYYGRLIKPYACEECNTPTPKEDLHGHHDDYSKKLEVEWLCPRCHGKRHREE